MELLELSNNFTLIPLMNTAQIKTFSACQGYLLKLRLLKINILYKISKNEHFNITNYRPTEPFEFYDNFPLMPAIKKTQINNIECVSRLAFEIVIA